ncbi:hypothetical protein MLD38_018795 [Melastoma candidum]|uniref:Uncharacterized protein n=1 Tax=Melastoma candidum TaxID=119954 RepID=A0ACB9QU38_9MYRT|nr:hypothetical protein MLD38_018795 [Melastoma candidum]
MHPTPPATPPPSNRPHDTIRLPLLHLYGSERRPTSSVVIHGAAKSKLYPTSTRSGARNPRTWPKSHRAQANDYFPWHPLHEESCGSKGHKPPFHLQWVFAYSHLVNHGSSKSHINFL